MSYEIDVKNVTSENLKYLELICSNDFYQNDKEFVNVVQKLTKESASMSHKALNLITLLDEAERIKFDMVQKEIKLGLSKQERPFGSLKLETLTDNVLVYTPMSELKRDIDRFIELLESYFLLNDVGSKKALLYEAKESIEKLTQAGESPKFFINTRVREKVWHILEHDFDNTMKRFEIDLFMEKMRLIRIEHQAEIDGIRLHYKRKENAYAKIKSLRADKTNNHSIEFQELEKIIKEPLGESIYKLLNDTQKLMSTLLFKIESIADELTPSQLKELEAFMPALSEYFEDQVYGISGGNSYTKTDALLQQLQNDIDKGSNLRVLLDGIDKLDGGMQHLYLLHWIEESLLKDILNCTSYSCSLGMTIRAYPKKFKETKTELKPMINAVNVRNDIAHNGLVWRPQELKDAVMTYRKYIETLIRENRIEILKYTLKKQGRELTQAQITQKDKEFIDAKFKLTYEGLQSFDNTLFEELIQTLHEKKWKLNQENFSRFTQKIKDLEHTQMNLFARETFGIDFEELEEVLLEAFKTKNINFEGNDFEAKKEAMKSFIWLYHNQDHENTQKNIDLIKKRIEG